MERTARKITNRHVHPSIAAFASLAGIERCQRWPCVHLVQNPSGLEVRKINLLRQVFSEQWNILQTFLRHILWVHGYLYTFLVSLCRYEMVRDDAFYNQPPMLRTIKELITESPNTGNEPAKEMFSMDPQKKRPKKCAFGQKLAPLIHIPLDHVVIDELHLMLRITDVLKDNLIREAIEIDSKAGVRNFMKGPRLKQLVAAFNQCGVSFQVWEKTNADRSSTCVGGWAPLKCASIQLSVSQMSAASWETVSYERDPLLHILSGALDIIVLSHSSATYRTDHSVERL